MHTFLYSFFLIIKPSTELNSVLCFVFILCQILENEVLKKVKDSCLCLLTNILFFAHDNLIQFPICTVCAGHLHHAILYMELPLGVWTFGANLAKLWVILLTSKN